jgi:sphingosine kinase
MDGAASGQIFHNTNTRYYRCSSYRLTPLTPQGYISIDGESVPHESFQVEVHQGLARCLSLGGRFWGEKVEVK